MKIYQLTPFLGAEVLNVDLSAEINDDTFAVIHNAFVTHSVLIFRNQKLSPQNMIDFSQRFGPLMIHVLKDSLLEGQPEIYKLSNRNQGRIHYF